MEPGRARKRYTIARIRLINFHNFVDETIELRDGGHLFLLGDNEAGKTTVLDALHYALSGGHDLELNAAARMGGRRDEGRSIQGIVLRLNPEGGELNAPGAIAYAVVELSELDGPDRLCFGIGTQATTLEARVTRWGFIRRGPLESLELLRGDEHGLRRPAGRDELRDFLGKADTFLSMPDYRKALADRLFDGGAPYDDVCRFWGTAKAYREIVSRSRDFDALFSELLPAPDTQVFSDILRSLREIDDLEVTLRELDTQSTYIAGLVELTAEIARQREACARYTWLAIYRERAEEEELLAGDQGALAKTEVAVVDAGFAVASRQARLDGIDQTIAVTKSADADGILATLQAAERELRERQAEAGQAERVATAERARAGGATAARDTARRAMLAELVPRLERLASLPSGESSVQGPASRLGIEWRAIQEALEARGSLGEEIPELSGAEDRALEREIKSCKEAQRPSDLRLQSSREALGRADAELNRLRQLEEEVPDVWGFTEACAALEEEGHQVVPLFRALAPAIDAPPERLAALEALLGDAVLGALLVPGGDHERACKCLRAVDSDARIVMRTSEDAELPEWISSLFAPPRDELDRVARESLATALSQPAAFGAVSAPTVTDDVELRGLSHRVRARVPRLLGVDARRRAHATRLGIAEGRRADAVSEGKAAALEAELLDTRLDQLDRASRAFTALEEDEFRRRCYALRGAEKDAFQAQQAETKADESAEAAGTRVVDKKGLVDALQGRAKDRGLDDVARRMSELEEQRRKALGGLDEEKKRKTLAEDAVGRLQTSIRGRKGRRAEIDARLERASIALKGHAGVPSEDDALERYVLVTQRGSAFRSRETVEERRVAAHAAERDAASELSRDGSRGVKNLQYSAQFGFSYDRDSNRLEDRRQQPAEGVLAELNRNIAEQREVVGEKTRELMDKLVMGQLARHLRVQVELLNRMVKAINGLLERLRFGTTRYQFSVTPKKERGELIELVRSLSLLDDSKRQAFRAFIDERIDELKAGDEDSVPPLLDYRRWFDYRLRRGTGDGTELTRELRLLGSGGEQAVPNYLLVLALAKLMFDNAQARVRPLMFDEAFYGIDAGRRDELMRFATELGLQLIVASPDQDGVTPAVRAATTLFVVKDEACDVHLAPYHFWNREVVAQANLFETPDANAAETAVCRVTNTTT
jgi:hypothetical protein